MTSATTTIESTRTGADLRTGIGLPGRVAVTWSVAGGVLLGGFLVAAMTLAGRLSGNALLLTSGGLYLIGAMIGFTHGAVLGFFGRGAMGVREFLGKIGLAAAYAIPVVAIGFVVTGWIAMTMVALYLDKVAAMAGVVVGWTAGLALVIAAALNGWRALRKAYARWPEAEVGTVLVAATFAALLVVFLADRPMLWGLHFRVTEVGAVLLAWFASIWIAGPVITMALRLLRRLPTPLPVLGGQGRSAWVSVLMGLAAGVVLSLIALPFYHPPVALAAPVTGTVGAVVVSVSHALLDEVLLRVFLVTGMTWLLLRWHKVHAEEAAVFAVGLAALVQVVLYLPGVLALGLPSWIATIGYILAAVLVPGLAFGFLFWKRGLLAAVTGHAVALIAIALLV